jgi:hypothetical protein
VADATSCSPGPPAVVSVPSVSISRRDVLESRLPQLEIDERESAIAGLRMTAHDEQEGQADTECGHY